MQEDGSSRADAGVESQEASVNRKRFLPWDLHGQIDVTPAHQCGLASR
jgi:hypothetical protein